MRSFFVFVMVSVISGQLFADGKISEIDKKRKTLLIKIRDSDVKEGMTMSLTHEDGRECSLPIQKVIGKTVVGSYSSCRFSDDIKIGDTVKIDKKTIKPIEIEKENKEITTKSTKKIIDESWFYKASFGMGGAGYSGNHQAKSQIKNANDGTQYALVIDIAGFYWPIIQQKALLGVNLSYMADSYNESTDSNGNYAGNDLGLIFQKLYSLSLLYFENSTRASGFYYQLDIGFASYEASLNDRKIKEESGYGGVIGLGYSIELKRQRNIWLFSEICG